MEAKPNYDSGYLRVEPKSAGDFGYVSISSIRYENDTHLSDMVDEIKRHIDRVSSATISYDCYVCGKCGNGYDTKNEAENCCKDTEVKETDIDRCIKVVEEWFKKSDWGYDGNNELVQALKNLKN